MLKMGNGHEKQADSEGGKTKMNRIEDVTDYITECDKEVGEALEELEGGAVHVVPRKKKYIWDLIQEGCGYPTDLLQISPQLLPETWMKRELINYDQLPFTSNL